MTDASVRADYDALAAAYAERFPTEPTSRPIDRAMYQVFAELVGPNAKVADVGSGPGVATAHLRELGLDAHGVDLSPQMVAIARAAYPAIRFDEGSLSSLPIADQALDGVLARYSIIHTPPAEMPAALTELSRVLQPGGHIMLAFFAGEAEQPEEFDHKVTRAWRWPVGRLAEDLEPAGLAEVFRLIREPGENERFRQAVLLARKEGTKNAA